MLWFFFFWPWGMWDFSSPTRDQICIPCIGKGSLNHWTTREVPPCSFLHTRLIENCYVDLIFCLQWYIFVLPCSSHPESRFTAEGVKVKHLSLHDCPRVDGHLVKGNLSKPPGVQMMASWQRPHVSCLRQLWQQDMELWRRTGLESLGQQKRLHGWSVHSEIAAPEAKTVDLSWLYFFKGPKSCKIPSSGWAAPVALVVKNLPDKAGDSRNVGSFPGSGRSPGGGHGSPLQYFAWRIPRTKEPGGLQSMGSQRVGHNWRNFAHTSGCDISHFWMWHQVIWTPPPPKNDPLLWFFCYQLAFYVKQFLNHVLNVGLCQED